MHRIMWCAALAAAGLLPTAAVAQDIALDPIVDARLRYENVDQDNALENANALTLRVRAGLEAKAGEFSLLAETEATTAFITDYNAFPFAEAEEQRRTTYSVVPDPMNVELNRLQLGWTRGSTSALVGRQRIDLDDQRWVGSVGWRQNEQTFDAVRGRTAFGPVSLDATWAISQRTIFGMDAGPRQSYEGNFVFLGAGLDLKAVKLKTFAYLLDYDDALIVNASSQTYCALAQGKLALGPAAVEAKASYARQSDWKDAASDYAADYALGEASATLAGFTFTGGYEHLGSDNGTALQTPLATLHKFNGFADVFLATPANGLADAYVGLSRSLPLPGKPKAAVTFHQFDSTTGNLEYGTEWDATLAAKLGRFALLAKYARYRAEDFGVDMRKLWLQVETAF